MDSLLTKHLSPAPDLRFRAEKLVEEKSATVHSPRTEAELRRLVHELEVHQIELELQNAELLLTREALATANIDLEAFNYTVSHDLRKPLSIIYGYCEALLQMPGNELDEQSRDSIQAMYKASQRMKRLITSLLRFSCASRAPLNRTILDLSEMVHAVAKDLQLANLEPRIRFRIAEGIIGNGDPSLCHIALDNLIGNAWKHACSQTGALIEFGAESVSGEQIYFVRDNGPGFDMSLADQLFAPFQRLSGASVEGYGIGLATVERIVSHHGGRIWVESEPGKGATFFFTLE